jgi:phage FluMu protein gp41
MLASNLGWWEIPTTMTVVADNKKRVTLRLAKPGDRFDVQVSPEGRFVLTKLEPVRVTPPAKVRIEKRGEYHVGVLEQPIDEEALKEALADFP